MKICLIYLVKYPKYLLDIPCQLLLFKDLVHLSYVMSEGLLDLLPTIEIFFNYIDKDLKDLLDTIWIALEICFKYLDKYPVDLLDLIDLPCPIIL